jgi:hypothetical protein
MVKPRPAPATKLPGRCKAIAAKACSFKHDGGRAPGHGPRRTYQWPQVWPNALVSLTGIVIGVALESLSRKADEKKAFELRSPVIKFRNLSDGIKVRTASSGWPDNLRDLKSAILSAFTSARKFDLWVPSEHVARGDANSWPRISGPEVLAPKSWP